MADPLETPYADFTRKYVGWAGEIAGVWLPGAGIVAKLIEKAPLVEFEKYVRGRARGDHLKVMEVAAPEAAAFAAPPGSGDGNAPPVAAAPQAPAAPIVLKVDDLLRQYEAVRESEPFRVALGLNLHVAVTQLETFMQETAFFSGVQHDTKLAMASGQPSRSNGSSGVTSRTDSAPQPSWPIILPCNP